MGDSVNVAARTGMPDSLKKILEKLPSAEAIKIVDDIGKTAWIIDNNNNNNKASALHDRIIDNVSKLSADHIKTLLDVKE